MKQIIEKVALGALLLLAIIIGPALLSANKASQGAVAILAAAPVAGNDYVLLNPLNRDQLIDVIKCLTDGSGIGIPKCVSRVTSQPPASTTPSRLTASLSSYPLRSSNFRVNSYDALAGVPLLNFDVRSDSGASQLQTLTVNASGTRPSTIYLYDGSTLVKSKSVPASGIVVFDNLYLSVPKDVLKTLVIKGDFPSNTPTGSVSMVGVTAGTYQMPNGTVANMVMGASIWGPMQHIFTATAVINLAGTPTITSTATASGSTNNLIATFPLTLQALGNNVIKPSSLGSDFTVVFTNGTVQYVSTSKSVVVIPNNDIADGSTANVSVTALANNSNLPTSGLYTAKITSIRWTIAGVSTTQTWGLEDYKTPNAAVFNK